jgi:ATP-binding protein involved in chromosome partitioning
MELLPEMAGVIIVTIPSEVSRDVVKKAVTFARMMNVPVIGVIENMSEYICPNCGTHINIFGEGGGKKIAEDMNIPFLGKIPIDPKICKTSDEGIPFILENPDSCASKAFMKIVKKIKAYLEHKEQPLNSEKKITIRD